MARLKTIKDNITNLSAFVAALGGVIAILSQYQLVPKAFEGWALATIALAGAITSYYTGKNSDGTSPDPRAEREAAARGEVGR